MSNNNNNIAVAVPKYYYHVSDCPHCGAPIYVDAYIQGGNNHADTKVADSLPMPYFTCSCRYLMGQPAPNTNIWPNGWPYPPVQPVTIHNGPPRNTSGVETLN